MQRSSSFLQKFMNQPGPIYTRIKEKLSTLNPSVLDIQDDTHKHRGHAAMKGLNPQETHFRITIVSDAFQGKRLVQRHRLIYDLLSKEIKEDIHALQLTTQTAEEHAK